MIKKKQILNLRLSEAAELLKSVTVDKKVKDEIVKFLDQVGKSSSTLIKEVLSVVTDNIANALSNALDNKVNQVKLKVEGGNVNVIEETRTENDGSDIGRKN